MSTEKDYWAESLSIAADECELTLTPEQLAYLASAASSAHEHYGMAFYSPPAGDRLGEIEREWKAKLKAEQDRFNKYRNNAETAVKRALRIHSADPVTIEAYGQVYRHGGRSEQIL
jgi:hypothetical protein